ncbi:hypothetical protein NSK_007796 [Nannochloropsis salina CCMP1776]|uniref:Uncharacterized protein n=1 Tax=Nannochloropsis salina CCMP1776 TaxID=1027361 RepID=A0A4D9CW38_9STRA|nr:hypothetical protein NSK_007796 [Nannochloropsis salina CCMP1776]|eukprot:TFJ80869.1 hypothetical protein NSK_007796 [Nannochloropsis salina CCMP1776]
MLPSTCPPGVSTTLQNKVIVITGASSGIGLALAKRACVLGAMVVLAARSEMKLTSLADELGRDSASKHALNAITTAFRLEALKEEGKEGGAQVQVSSVLPGMVATEFGINTLGPPGADSRTLAAAQPVEEVVDVIVDLILNPQADVYTKAEHKEWVKEYFTADRMEEVERHRPPWTNVR